MWVMTPHSANNSEWVDCIVLFGPSDGPAPVHSCSLSARSMSHAKAPLFLLTDASDPVHVVAPLARLLAKSAESHFA